MPKRRPHWIDETVSDLREDISEMIADVREAFSDLTPLGGPKHIPSVKERIKGYLSMTPQERQMLFLELGPEGYTEFVDKAMDDLVRVFGADANAALSWFMGVGPEQGLSPDEVEMTAMRELGGGFRGEDVGS